MQMNLLKGSDTYKLNFPNTFVDTRDIRTITHDDILSKINLKVGELDFLDGSPPCTSFSLLQEKDKRELG